MCWFEASLGFQRPFTDPIASSGIHSHCLLDLFPTNRTHPQSLCKFQATAYVAAWYEDHVCFFVQTNLRTTALATKHCFSATDARLSRPTVLTSFHDLYCGATASHSLIPVRFCCCRHMFADVLFCINFCLICQYQFKFIAFVVLIGGWNTCAKYTKSCWINASSSRINKTATARAGITCCCCFIWLFLVQYWNKCKVSSGRHTFGDGTQQVKAQF